MSRFRTCTYALLTSMMLLVSLFSTPVMAAPATSEKDIENAVQTISNEYRNEIADLMGKAGEVISQTASDRRETLISEFRWKEQKLYDEWDKAIAEYFGSIGWVNIGVEERDEAQPTSVNTDLEYTQSVWISMDYPGQICYTCRYYWLGPLLGNPDALWKPQDLVSSMLRYDNGWRITKYDLKAYDAYMDVIGRVLYENEQIALETGVTSFLAQQWVPGDALVFYVNEGHSGDLFNPLVLVVDILAWIRPGSTSSNQIKSDYLHNWGLGAINNFSVSWGGLSASYSGIVQDWTRGTPGLTISLP